MPTLIKVPESISRVAKRGLEVHTSGPALEDVYGVKLARSLSAGEVLPAAVTQCHRFFQTQERAYEQEVRELRTEDDSALVRSWLLHGGDVCREWASRAYARMVEQKLAPRHPLAELMELAPRDVYSRFSAGAWRHEYGLTPVKAARFVEQYEIATGNELDLDRAFGPAKLAVENALTRRQDVGDVAKRLRQLECVRDPLYRVAVEIDTASLIPAGLNEASFTNATYTTFPPPKFSKYAWPVVIAYVVLAAENPEALVAVNHGNQPPAPMDKPLKVFSQYNDTENFIQAVFHPKGKRYKDPTTIKDGFYTGIDYAMLALLFKGFKGKYISATQAQKTLNLARGYLSVAGMLGSTLFATLLADWKKGNWQGILAAIPTASDVYEPFKAFADKGLKPVDGADLTQTAVQADLDHETLELLGPEFKAVSIETTEAGKTAKESGTPIGVGSLVQSFHGTVEIVGAFNNSVMTSFVFRNKEGKLTTLGDGQFAASIKTGVNKVVQGHADLPGTKYPTPGVPANEPKPLVPTPASAGQPPKKPPLKMTAASPEEIPPDVLAHAQKQFAGPTSIAISDTASFKAAVKTVGKPLVIGSKLTGEAGSVFTIAAAVTTGGVKHLILKEQDGSHEDIPDTDLAQLIKDGEVWLAGTNVSKAGGVTTKFANWIEYFTAQFAASIKQWTQFAIPDTDAAEAYLNKYNHDLVAGTVLMDKNGHPFRIEGAFYNKYSGATLIVYRNPDGTFNEVPDDKLAAGITNGKAKPNPGAAHQFPEMVDDPDDGDEPDDEDNTPTPPPAPIKFLDPANATVYYPHPKAPPASPVPTASPNLDLAQNYVDKEGLVGKFIPLTVTQSAGASIGKGKNLDDGTHVFFADNGAEFEILAAFDVSAVNTSPKVGETLIIWKGLKTGTVADVSDFVVSQGIASGSIVFSLPVNPEHLAEVGDIIKVEGDAAPYVVLAISDTASQYLLYRLAILGFGGAYAQSVSADKLKVFKPQKIGDYKNAGSVIDLLPLPQGASTVATPPEWGVKYFSPVQWEGKTLLFLAAVDTGINLVRPLMGLPQSVSFNGGTYNYYEFVLASSDFFKNTITPTYAPTDLVPEPASVDAMDEPDAEAGNPELSGTQKAFDYLTSKKWIPANKSEAGAFMWDLGDILKYPGGGDSALRTIIGYGWSGTLPIYVMTTQTGIVNFKGAVTGNAEYGPKIGTEQAVIDAALPKPGTAAPKYPKLNYGLSPLAKQLAEKFTLVYSPSSKNAPFQVGTLLMEKAFAPGAKPKKMKLVGWENSGDGTPLAVLSNKDGSEWFKVSSSGLKASWEITFQHTNLIDDTTGELVFGKAANVKPIHIWFGDTILPSDKQEETIPAIQQPAFTQLPKSGHASAGVFAIFPSGITVSGGGDADDTFQTPYASVVMTHPMNDYGGYSLTFPKGTIEPGESVEKAAAREFFEETGMTVKLVEHLGDFKGGTSVTRMFVGYVTGGNPHKAGPETDAVTLKPFGSDYANAAWYKALHKRDQAILAAGWNWLTNAHAYPHQAPVKVAEQYTQVTGPQDNAGVSAGTSDDNGETFPAKAYADNQAASKVDYTCPASFLTYHAGQCKEGVKSWEVLPQAPFWKKGYPKVGTWVKTSYSEPFQVLAYIRIEQSNTIYGVMYGIKQDAQYQSVYIYSYAEGQKKTVLTLPTEIKAAVWKQGMPTPGVAAPANTVADTVWNALIVQSPVPISKKFLSKIKSAWKEISGPDGAQVPYGVKSYGGYALYGPGLPLYGDVYDFQGIKGLHCLGYVVFTKSGNVAVPTVFGQDSAGDIYYVPVTLSLIPSFKLDADATLASRLPQSAFKMPTFGMAQIADSVFKGIANTTVHGMNLKLWKQQFKEAGVPNFTGLTDALLVQALGLFVPNAITGVQRDAILQGLHHNAELMGTAQPIFKTTGDDTASLGFALTSQDVPVTTDYTINLPKIGTSGGTANAYLVTLNIHNIDTEDLSAEELKNASDFSKKYPNGVLVYAATKLVAKGLVVTDVGGTWEHATSLLSCTTPLKQPVPIPPPGGTAGTAALWGGTSASTPTDPLPVLGNASIPHNSKYLVKAGPTPSLVGSKFKQVYPNGVIVYAPSDVFAKGIAFGGAGMSAAHTNLLVATLYSGGSPTNTGAPVTPFAPVELPKLILPMGQYYSAQWKQQLASLDPKDFTKTSESAPKGTNPTFILEGPGGSKWFAKAPKDGDAIRPAAEEAAYKLIGPLEFETVPVGAMTFNGQPVSIQPLITGLDPLSASSADPNEESDENKATLLRNHVYDMFITDHDGNRMNWLKKSGKLIRIDRGQAFKFYLEGDGPVLDPTHQPSGNVGAGYAKDLLIAWSKSEAEIPQSAFSAMREAIAAIQDLSDDVIKSVLEKYFAAGAVSPAKQTKALKLIKQTRAAYLDDWTSVLKKLKKTFVWPAYEAPPKNVFHVDPKKQGLTLEHAQTIKEANEAGWQGKALPVDGPYLENQEMMVRRVMWDVKQGQRVPATLIHFRMSRAGGLAASKAMLKHPFCEVSSDLGEEAGGAARIKADTQNSFWEPIFTAIKNINYYFAEQKKASFNQAKIDAALSLQPQLQALKDATANPEGIYAPSNESNEIVNSMAGQYLQYLTMIDYYNTASPEVKQALITATPPVFGPFKYEKPKDVTATPKGTVEPTFRIFTKAQGATEPAPPKAYNKKDGVIFSALNQAVFNSSSQSQFHVLDANNNAHIFLNPPHGVDSGMSKTVEGHKGIGWGIMPGEPSPKTIAHLLGLMQEATGLSLSPSTQQDQEALYWIKQGVTIQNKGVTQPDSNDEAGLAPELKKAQDAYKSGGAKAAITVAKQFVASELSIPVAQLEKQPGYDPAFGQYTRGAGWKRQLRLGWTRSKLTQTLGKTTHFGHNTRANDSPSEGNLLEFFQKVINNGALLSNNTKPFYGIPPGGASPSSDYPKGGSQSLFMCLRKDWYTGLLYFDIDLSLRTDVYMVGTGDTFGNTSMARNTTPEKWVSVGGVGSGTVTWTSSFQMNARHDVDLQQYLHTVVCKTVEVRNQIRELCKSVGWMTFAQGRTLEQVIVKHGDETQ